MKRVTPVDIIKMKNKRYANKLLQYKVTLRVFIASNITA